MYILYVVTNYVWQGYYRPKMYGVCQAIEHEPMNGWERHPSECQWIVPGTIPEE